MALSSFVKLSDPILWVFILCFQAYLYMFLYYFSGAMCATWEFTCQSLENICTCMYVCKTLFTDASLVNKIVGFHKGRQTIKKRIKEDIYKRTEKERKKKK